MGDTKCVFDDGPIFSKFIFICSNEVGLKAWTSKILLED